MQNWLRKQKHKTLESEISQEVSDFFDYPTQKRPNFLSKGNPVFFYIILLTYLKFCRLWR